MPKYIILNYQAKTKVAIAVPEDFDDNTCDGQEWEEILEKARKIVNSLNANWEFNEDKEPEVSSLNRS